MVAANIDLWIAWGRTRVTQVFGMNNQGSIVYIQLFDQTPQANGHMAAGSVPKIKSLQCLANAPFFFTVDLTLEELMVALSTTEVNYTAVGAAGGLDMTVVCDTDYLCTGNEVIVGDTTTALNTKAIFAAAQHRLLKLQAIEQLGANRFLAIGGATVMPPGQERILLLKANANTTYLFGTAGLPCSIPIPIANLIGGKDESGTFDGTCTINAYDQGACTSQTAASVTIKAVYL